MTAGQTVVAIVEPTAPALLDTRSRVQAEAAVRESEAARARAESELRRAEEDLAYAKASTSARKPWSNAGWRPSPVLRT